MQAQLRIVRRQPVRAGAHEVVKVAPRLTGQTAQVQGILAGQRLTPIRGIRVPQPPHHHRREHPESHEGRRCQPGVAEAQHDHEKQRETADYPHLAARGSGVPVDGGSRAFRRLPLQQVAMADGAAVRYPRDGIHRQPGLMRQEGQHDRGAQQFIGGATPAIDGALHNARPAVEKRCHRWNGDCESYYQAPNARRGGDQPSEQQQQQRSYRDQASAQIVEDAPAADDRKRVRFFSARCRRHLSEHPGSDLPIAANPTVQPLAVARVIQRQVFKQFDSRRQPHPGVSAFDQIVTQQTLVREAVA